MNITYSFIIELTVYIVVLWIALKARGKAKEAALGYLLYGLTRLSFFLLILFNLLGIQISSTIWIVFLAVLSVLGIIIYLLKKNRIAINYSAFVIIFMLFGSSPIITGWLPFGYVVYSYLNERTKAKHS